MDLDFIHLVTGLVILIIANIILGSLNAIFTHDFHVKKFFIGIGKGVLVAACAAGLYYAGSINPTLVVVDLGDQQLTILAAIHGVILAGYYFYAKQVFEKLSAIVIPKA